MHLVKLQVHQCFSSNGASPAVPSASGALSCFPPCHESSESVNSSSPLMLESRLIMRTAHIITTF